jgi:hypothetical protein
LFQRFSQYRHRPPGIEDFFCCQKLDRLESIAFFGAFCIQLYEFLVSSSLKAASTVDRIREVVSERGEHERPEFTFEPVNAGKRPVFQQGAGKNLGSGHERHPANVRGAERKCRVDTNRAGATRLTKADGPLCA